MTAKMTQIGLLLALSYKAKDQTNAGNWDSPEIGGSWPSIAGGRDAREACITFQSFVYPRDKEKFSTCTSLFLFNSAELMGYHHSTKGRSRQHFWERKQILLKALQEENMTGSAQQP